MNIDKSGYPKFVQPDQMERRAPSRPLAPSRSLPARSLPENAEPENAEIDKVCTEFASIFFHTLLKSMHSTIPKSSFCPEFQGKDLVNSIVDQGVSQSIAQDGAGLKELLLGKLMNDKVNDKK